MDRMTGNLPACYLFGSLSASVLYSAYVVAFGASVYFLSNVRGRRVQPNKIILAVSVILFVCVTVHWLLGVAYIYTAFVVHGDTANGALAFFSGPSMLQIAQLYVASMVIALLDGALVYRMYIVWGRSWPLVILPSACIAAYLTLATILMQTSIHISHTLSDPSRLMEVLHEEKTLRTYVTIAFSLSVAANSFPTTMIIVRILCNSLKRAGTRSITRPAIHLLLESAVVCCACDAMTLATFLLNNNGMYFILEIIPMVVGLSYSAIIIRVGLGIAEGGSSPLPNANAAISSLQFASRPRNHAHANTLAISVDQEVSVGGRSENGGGSGSRSNGPESELECVDETSADMHGIKLERPWETPA